MKLLYAAPLLLLVLTGCHSTPEAESTTQLTPAEAAKTKSNIESSNLPPAAKASALAELKRKSP